MNAMSTRIRKNQVAGMVWMLWAVWMTALAFPLHAQENPPSSTVNVIGTSLIQKQNVPEARERAVANGLSSAVNQIALTLVPPESVTRDFQKFSTLLAGKADEFVSTYKVLSENQAGESYRVMLQVTVSSDSLRERLAGIQTAPSQEAAPRAKVLFLISEQNLQDINPRFWWGEGEDPVSARAEEAMAERMRAAGFEVIEHGNDVPDVALEAAIIFQPDLDNREALDIGKSFLADLVIVGKAMVYKVPDTMEEEVPSFNATVTARALRVDNGEEIASVLESVVQKHPDDAEGGMSTLMAAGAQTGENLADRIAPVWQQAVNPADAIELAVTGARNLGNFIRFRKALTDIPGVQSIHMRETRPDQAFIEVDYQGPAQGLAEALQSLSFQLFTVEISSVSDQRVAVGLAPKGAMVGNPQ